MPTAMEADWNQTAAAYEDFTAGEDSSSRRIEWPCIQTMLPDLRGKSVIDLGCGTGCFTFWLEKLGPSRVPGVDIAENMLIMAKEKAAKNHSIAEFVRRDLSLPFTAETFDLVFSSTLTHYLQGLNVFFQTVYGPLKPGGRCILSVMHPIYTAQYPLDHQGRFPTNEEWSVRYLDQQLRSYVQPWFEHNDNLPDRLSSSYHHTFGDYLNVAARSGLVLREVREPLPPADWQESCPGRYEDFLMTPTYLVLCYDRP